VMAVTRSVGSRDCPVSSACFAGHLGGQELVDPLVRDTQDGSGVAHADPAAGQRGGGFPGWPGVGLDHSVQDPGGVVSRPFKASRYATPTRGAPAMPTQLAVIWMYLRAKARVSRDFDETGTVVEKVILTAIFAALAIAVGAIIVAKVTAKANSINLG
jgi:hypothetical protein